MKQRDIADPTLTCVQIEFINKLLRDMAAQPPGNGSITIVIHNGHLIYIVPAPNLSGLRPSGRSLDWPQPGEQDDPC